MAIFGTSTGGGMALAMFLRGAIPTPPSSRQPGQLAATIDVALTMPRQASGVLVSTAITGFNFSRTPASSSASTRPPLSSRGRIGSGVAAGAKN
jgi:hypothetical protein